MISDSKSDMDLISEKSGFSYKLRSSHFGTSETTTPVSDCHRLKMTLEKLEKADHAMNFYGQQICHCNDYYSVTSSDVRDQERIVLQSDIVGVRRVSWNPFPLRSEIDSSKKGHARTIGGSRLEAESRNVF
ncbi:hypothetical protein TNCV_2846781 [Trichonephila clavipes]|nr:hypothetical protein TNCV_2846781 [Trichonephila clavipes]